MQDGIDSVARSALLDRALTETVTEWGSSKWAELRRCPRAYKLRVVQNVRPRGGIDNNLAIGIAVHQVLAFVGLLSTRGIVATESDMMEALDQLPPGPPRSEAFRLLRGYFMRHGYTNAGLPEPLYDVEVLLEAAVGALPYTARVDAVTVGPTGLFTPWDHKTRGTTVPWGASETWATRPQFLGHAYLARAVWGDRWSRRVMVNAIVKTKTPGYERVELAISDFAIDRWAEEQSTQAPRLLELAASGCANYDSCAPEIGRRCQYFSYCHGNDSDRESMYETVEQEAR